MWQNAQSIETDIFSKRRAQQHWCLGKRSSKPQRDISSHQPEWLFKNIVHVARDVENKELWWGGPASYLENSREGLQNTVAKGGENIKKRYICVHITAALFVMYQPQLPSMDEGLKKMWCRLNGLLFSHKEILRALCNPGRELWLLLTCGISK